MGHTIPSIQIDDEASKFILAEVTDNYGQNVTVVRATKGDVFHRDIFEALKKEKGVRKVNILGGGFIRHSPEEFFVETTGQSFDFGPPPKLRLQTFLNNELPEYLVRVF